MKLSSHTQKNQNQKNKFMAAILAFIYFKNDN